MTLTLTEWLELEQILSCSRKARRLFRQRYGKRVSRWKAAANWAKGYPQVQALG